MFRVKSIFFIFSFAISYQNIIAKLPDGFVSIADLDKSIVVNAKYFTNDNFIGQTIDGYKANKCILTIEAAKALIEVQKELKKAKLSLEVFDCYRPQRAVNHFVRWAKDISDTKMKEKYYPKVEKKNLFKYGYIASKSGHSRGSTIDLTIIDLDMGTIFDYFDPLTHTLNPNIPPDILKNRLILKTNMEKFGFKNYKNEWWHYTLINEPYKNKYFDFIVE